MNVNEFYNRYRSVFAQVNLNSTEVAKFYLFIFFISVLTSCGKVNNSSTSDPALVVSGSSEFIAAKQVLAQNCITCHAHSSWASYSEADFKSKGLFVRKSPTSSEIYIRIRGNDAGIAGDMPESGSNLSVADIQTIKSWINSN